MITTARTDARISHSVFCYSPNSRRIGSNYRSCALTAAQARVLTDGAERQVRCVVACMPTAVPCSSLVGMAGVRIDHSNAPRRRSRRAWRQTKPPPPPGHRFLALEHGRYVGTPSSQRFSPSKPTCCSRSTPSRPSSPFRRPPHRIWLESLAILELRALYLVLASFLKDLKYIHFPLATILIFAGAEMLASSVLRVSHWVSLASISAMLPTAIIPSFVGRRGKARPAAPPCK